MKTLLLTEIVGLAVFAFASAMDCVTARLLSDHETATLYGGDDSWEGYIEVTNEFCEDCWQPEGLGVWVKCLGDDTHGSRCKEMQMTGVWCHDETYICGGTGRLYPDSTCSIPISNQFGCSPEYLRPITIGVTDPPP